MVFSMVFFNNLYFCQYCVLQKNQNNELEISLFDSKEKLAYNGKSKDRIRLGVPSQMDSKYIFLFAHGYQFESWYTLLKFASSVWKGALESPDSIKESLNILYNVIYKKPQINIQI